MEQSGVIITPVLTIAIFQWIIKLLLHKFAAENNRHEKHIYHNSSNYYYRG